MKKEVTKKFLRLRYITVDDDKHQIRFYLSTSPKFFIYLIFLLGLFLLIYINVYFLISEIVTGIVETKDVYTANIVTIGSSLALFVIVFLFLKLVISTLHINKVVTIDKDKNILRVTPDNIEINLDEVKDVTIKKTRWLFWSKHIILLHLADSEESILPPLSYEEAVLLWNKLRIVVFNAQK